jgi:c-di-GMP-binding flagellar brake protein YcgR
MSENDHGEDDRRQAFRIEMENEIIDISWFDKAGEVVTRRIACIDFSRGGLKINCDSAIEIDTLVTIIFRAAHENSQNLKGKVLRCLKQNNGWFDIGIQLDNDNR